MHCQNPLTTLFRLRCEADQVYLRLRPGHGSSPQMIPMHRSGEGIWTVKLPLPSGTYHYRFYYIAHGGRMMMYHPPDELAGRLQFEGLDGVVRVGDEPRPLPGPDGCPGDHTFN